MTTNQKPKNKSVNGADVSAQDNSGNTPLYAVVFTITHDAASSESETSSLFSSSSLSYEENAEMAAFLLDHGADVSARDNEGKTPLDHSLSAIIGS